ncbi:MAG: tripartite tricarboxylate transporter substrate binding protein [Pusillimonas sp.]
MSSKAKVFSFLLLSFIFLVPVHAQDAWPSRPITLIVPYPAGGATDVVGRLVAKGLGEQLGISVVVENKAGASGNIAGRTAARAKPDGYTLFLATTAQSINMAIFSEPGYDLAGDFQSVATINEGPMLLLAARKLPFSTLAGLLDYASRQNNELRYASAGNGTSSHMTAEIFSHLAGIRMQHIPYIGAAPALNALLGDQVDLAFDALMTTLPHVREGKLNALGLTSLERSRIAPEIPTIAEQKVAALSGFHEMLWNAVLVPKHTDAVVVDKLSAALKATLATEPIQKRFHEMGNEVLWRDPADSHAFVSSDVAQWKERVKSLNIAVN